MASHARLRDREAFDENWSIARPTSSRETMSILGDHEHDRMSLAEMPRPLREHRELLEWTRAVLADNGFRERQAVRPSSGAATGSGLVEIGIQIDSEARSGDRPAGTHQTLADFERHSRSCAHRRLPHIEPERMVPLIGTSYLQQVPARTRGVYEIVQRRRHRCRRCSRTGRGRGETAQGAATVSPLKVCSRAWLACPGPGADSAPS